MAPLKPCPWCGKVPEMRESEARYRPLGGGRSRLVRTFVVECCNAQVCEIAEKGNGNLAAIAKMLVHAKWNQRAPLPGADAGGGGA